jgi:hypothetical protein
MRRPCRAILVTNAFISFSGCAVGPDCQLLTYLAYLVAVGNFTAACAVAGRCAPQKSVGAARGANW